MKQKPQIDFPNDFRSYIIVALTVQTPLHVIDVGGRFTDDRYTVSVGPIPGETHTIIQPGGRLAAQVGHIVDIITTMTLKKYIHQHTCVDDELLLTCPKPRFGGFWTSLPKPMTRIILAARDSYELVHVHQLLKKAGIATYHFEDDNEEAYGPGVKIMTAIGTEPMHKEDTIGLIDYLPPWTPDKTDRPRL
jgi:peptidyl-tRNA hydrolase